MGDARKVSENLKLMYLGNVIAIVAAVCTLLLFLLPAGLVAGLVVIAALVGGIICLVGLARLRNEHEAYMKALIACVLGMVFNLFSKDNSIFGNLMSTANSVCGLLQIYFVVKGTNSFLLMNGFGGQAAMGERAWKWQLIEVVVGIIAVLAVLILPFLAVIWTLIPLVVGIAALVFYLSYLKASAEALR